MSGILKFCGGVVIVLCFLGVLASTLIVAGLVGDAVPKNKLGAALLGAFGGGILGICYFAGGMAVGTVLYVGGRALDHMDRTGAMTVAAGRRRFRRRLGR